jgi:DNA-binding MarR family transcriptional regulator
VASDAEPARSLTGPGQELARTLGLRESAVTALVTRLTSAGLLSKRPHPRQHRAVVLELTTTGENTLRAAQPEIDAFNAELRSLLGEEEFVRTTGALHRLAHWDE